jgi:ribosomal protein S12 methylthiotransferase accessory factor
MKNSTENTNNKNIFVHSTPDEPEAIEVGSFTANEWASIKQSNRQQVGDLNIPVPVPFRLYEPHPRKLDHVLNGAKRLYSRHCGVLAGALERDLFPDDPLCYSYSVEPCDSQFLNYDTVSMGRRNGNAAGLTRNEAVIAALGEVVERYAGGIYTLDSLVLASYEQLEAAGIKATPPEDYALYADDAYEKIHALKDGRFTRQAYAWWQWGYSLVTGESIMVPATYAQLPFTLNSATPKGPSFRDYSVSTGLASHSSLEEAMLRALYETVERDAVMLTWHNQLPTTGLHLEGATDPELLAVLASIPFNRDQWFLNDITLDIGISTVFGTYLCKDGGHKPYSVVAAATDLNPQKAAARCLKELILGYTAMTDYTLKPARAENEKAMLAGDYSKCDNLHLHFMLYAAVDLRSEMAFISNRPARWAKIENLPNRSTNTVLGDLEVATAAVAASDLDVIGLDLTSSDIAEVGFRLARVIIPGAQPLDPDHNARHLESRRLREIKRRLGLADRDMTVADYNKLPHPFP